MKTRYFNTEFLQRRETRRRSHCMRWWGSFLWWRWRCSSQWWRCWWLNASVERERGVLLAVKIKCWRLVFWPFLDPNLSTSGAWRSNLFIGGGRGTLCLFLCKISSIGSTRKHPNHWFKVTMMNCQFCAGKMAGQVGHFGAVPPPLKPQSVWTVYTSV